MAASESGISEYFSRLMSHRVDHSVSMPLIIAVAGATATVPQGDVREIQSIAVFNPFTQTMLVISVDRDGDSLVGSKMGQPPASKSSIDAMPTVDLTTESDDGNNNSSECAICLEKLKQGSAVVVKEMPCKHRFHGSCIEKWLKIHGSCPVCRYNMPIDAARRRVDGEEEEESSGGVRL